MIKKICLPLLFFLSVFLNGFSQSTYQIALLKYNGGGDWYANPTSLTNLIDFCNKNLKINRRQVFLFVAEIYRCRMPSFMDGGFPAKFGMIYQIKIV